VSVGIYPVIDAHDGGVYQYSLTVLDAMAHLKGELPCVIAHEGASTKQLGEWRAAGWDVIPFGPPTPRSVARQLVAGTLGDRAVSRIGSMVNGVGRTRAGRASREATDGSPIQVSPRGNNWLARHGIALMLYPQPTIRAVEAGIPFIVAVHDLQHRLQPEFPEVSADGEWARREHLFTGLIAHARTVLVDSEVGKEDVLRFYGDLTSPERVRVLPFVPPPYLRRPAPAEVSASLASLEIRVPYLLFPAQLWPHKNHLRVAQAIGELRRQGIDVTIVMTGSSAGDLRARVAAEVRDAVEREGIADLVRSLGFVNDEQMAALYAGSTGVILPTFFGPTNIPVIEGWAMGVPVLTSDIRGIREQCGDAAILVDPRSVESIAKGIRDLWTDEDLRVRLTTAGQKRLHASDRAAFQDLLAQLVAAAVPGRSLVTAG
jgi:glycosyltransferase involved in cell wall biosynthesis